MFSLHSPFTIFVRISKAIFQDMRHIIQTATAILLLTANMQGLYAKTFLPPEEVKTIKVGDTKVTWLQDNGSKQRAAIFSGVPQSLLDSLGVADGIPSSMSAFLVEREGKQILFDTGLGKVGSRLLPLLESLGIKPEDIKYLYLTHFHGDHIGGMLDGDKVVFPNAEVYASKKEYEAWMNMPPEKNRQAVKTMKAYKERLHLFEFGDTLPGNIIAMDAAGHTPGHTAFLAGKALIAGDIMHGVALQLVRPDVCSTYDMDKDAAIASRKRILSYAKKNGLLLCGMHFPAPAFLKLDK